MHLRNRSYMKLILHCLYRLTIYYQYGSFYLFWIFSCCSIWLVLLFVHEFMIHATIIAVNWVYQVHCSLLILPKVIAICEKLCIAYGQVGIIR